MGRLSLRAKIILYLLLIHAAFGGVAFLVLRADRLGLFAVEGLFVLSIAGGVYLVRAFFVPLALIRTGAELMAERDFNSRFREVGQPEMDALVRIYNRMVDQLREERLKQREQHHFLDRLLQASPVGIVTLDFDGAVATLNPAAVELLGVADAAAQGEPLTALGPPLGTALAGVPVGGTEVLALPGGRRVKASSAEFFDHGFARRFLTLEELTEELRASEKAAYGKLIRMMSHEVNNSVGAVGSLLDSCRGYGAQLSAEDRPDFLGAVEVATHRLQNLQAFMAGFADVVRLPDPERRPTDLGRLLDELLVLHRPELARRRIEVVWAERHDRRDGMDSRAPITVDLDRNQIEQVLVNVFKNAIEAIGEGGVLTLALGGDHLAVRDSGSGIAPGVEALLFTPFFSTKRDGRGLGLTLVREILSRHGMSFQLRNVEGGGAEFRLGW